MAEQNTRMSALAYRVLGARASIAELQQVNTYPLPDGAVCWVTATGKNYRYYRDSAVVADGTSVVQPGAGPGRWFAEDLSAYGASYITQGTWYVDSVNGNDNNTGATAGTALRTLAELTRRTEGRVLSSAISTFTVNLVAGSSFPTEPLSLNFSVANYVWIQINATTQIDRQGSITGFTTYSAGVTAALLDDAAAAFVAGDVGKRVRLTSGAGNGAIANVLKQISGTQIRVSDFYTRGTTGYGAPALTATPANGTTYNIETWTCQIGGLDIVIDGGLAAVTVDGVEFVRSSTNLLRTTLRGWCSSLPNSFKLFGCKLNTTGANLAITGSVLALVSSVAVGAGSLVISDASVSCQSLALMAPLAINQQGSLSGVSVFQQLQSTSPIITIIRNGNLNLSGNWAAYDLTGDAALIVEENGSAAHTAATAYWGIGAATSYGIRTRSMGIMIYTTKPTVSGSVNDTIVGGTATAYGAIPYVNPANNAAIVLRA